MLRPAPPPRRTAPTVADDDEEEYKPMGIAARIASLQLDQVGRTTKSPVVTKKSQPPLPPARKEYPAATAAPTPTDEELYARGDDFIRLISRIPPPVPSTQQAVAPAVPARRLPPMPARLPTPPPEPEPEPEVDEGYYSQEAADYGCLKCRDFSQVDDHAAQFPRHTVSSLDQLAIDLTSPWESETEKFRSIFTWMHHNITYDTDAFFSGNLQPSTADSVLQSGLAVCDGYAGLFDGLAARAGLQSIKVSGHGKGFGFAAPEDGLIPPVSLNHAWNCICMDGQWHLIDSCWGGGALEAGGTFNRRFEPIWFTSTVAEFGRRHHPTDPSYQLIADDDGGPISWEDYILAPEGPTIFKDFYQIELDRYTLSPPEKYIQSGQWHYFQVFKLCEHMSTEETDNWVYFINMPDQSRVPLQLTTDGGWAANVYIPEGPSQVSLYYVTTFDQRDAKGLSPVTFSRGGKAMSWGGLAKWEAI